jgi:DNA-binding IclR family transcriptional regulator
MKQAPRKLNSIEKALLLLMSFTPEHASWGVRDLSARLGFSPATVQRILQTLKAHAFIEQDPFTQQYRLGNIYFRFLETIQSIFPITRTALPFMQRLLSQTMETVHLNAIDQLERVCIETLESPRLLKAGMPVGNRSPLHAGASSKCLLAFSSPEFIETYLADAGLHRLTPRTITDSDALRMELERIRQQGYAASIGERTPGLGSLSAPILNHRGTIIAALSLAIPETRFIDGEHLDFCLSELVATAKQLSRLAGSSHH